MSTAEAPKFEVMPPAEIDVEGTDLNLRLFRDGDEEDLLRLVGSQEVRRFVPWAERIQDLNSAHESIERFKKSWDAKNRARYVVEKDGTFVGYAGIWSDTNPGYYEFGFALLPEYRKQGIGTQTISRFMEVAKTNLHAKGIIAYVHDDNTASIAAVTRLGLKPTEDFDAGDRRYTLDF